MQWIVGHRLELRLVVIYIRYWSAIDSLQWNVESTLELDYEGANTPIDPNGPCFELTNHDNKVYEGQIGSRIILMHKSVLVITQSCTRDNEQGLQIELIDYLDDPIWIIDQLGPILGQIK